MKPTRLADLLPPDTCIPALEWLGNRTDALAAWRECPRGDWLLTHLARTNANPQALTLAACACVWGALRILDDDRPRLAIDAGVAWAKGAGSIDDAIAASRDAYAHAVQHPESAPRYYAAAAAHDAARTCVDPKFAACAAFASVESGALTHERCAQLVRRYFPGPPVVG